MIKFYLNKENLEETGLNFKGNVKIPFNFKDIHGRECEMQTISEDAFAYNREIKALALEKGITSIGKYAFNRCSNLEYIWIPESVVNIGFMAFENCENLKTVKWDSPMQLSTEMINYIFYKCPNLEEILYHGKLIDVKKDDIDKIIASLHEEPVAPNVTTIEVLRIHASHYNINPYFSLHKDNKEEIGIDFSGDITIPNKFAGSDMIYKISQIKDDTFTHNKNITSVNIEDGIESIGKYAFNYCSNLESVTIPESVTNIGFMSFANCENLRTIKWDSPIQLTSEMIDYIFYNCPNIEKISYHGVSIGVKKDDIDKVIASLHEKPVTPNVTTIEDLRVEVSKSQVYKPFYMYNDNKDKIGIEFSGDITIPRKFKNNGIFYGILQIQSDTLAYNSDITSVNIESGIKNIGKHAFNYCSNLKSVTIPETIESIGKNAFSNCENLTEVIWNSEIPLTRELIEDIFKGCDKLEVINYHGKEIKIKNLTLDDIITENTDKTRIECQTQSLEKPNHKYAYDYQTK